jgi:ABC-2 type transport system ATP-binding protein
MIEVTGLRKRYGPAQALDGMTFSVRPGQVTGFVGPNGAGKSTTMRVILGLDAADEGIALIGGQPYRTLRHPQGLTAKRVDEVIDQAGLRPAIRRKAGGYSPGMRQRLGIAAALLGDPPVVMLERTVAALTAAHVPFSEVNAHRATLEEAYLELTRDAVEFKAGAGS